MAILVTAFHIGDEVTVTKEVDDYKGRTGVITEITAWEAMAFRVQFGDDSDDWCAFSSTELAPIKTRRLMDQSIADEYDYITRLGERG